MISPIPLTLEATVDRSIELSMRKRLAAESILDIEDTDRQTPLFVKMRRQAARWAADNLLSLMQTQPEMPAHIINRDRQKLIETGRSGNRS